MKYLVFLMIIPVYFAFESCSKTNKKANTPQYYTYEQYCAKLEEEVEFFEKENLNKVIANKDGYFGIDSLHSQTIADIAKGKRFFYCFSANTCFPCIESGVDCIKAVFPDYETDSTIVFVAMNYEAGYDFFFNKTVLTVVDESFGIPLDNINVPYLFKLNEKMEITDLIVVNKENSARTTERLKGWAKKEEVKNERKDEG